MMNNVKGIPIDKLGSKAVEDKMLDAIKLIIESIENGREIQKEFLSMIKNLDTRLSALEIVVQQIEKNYATVASVKPIIRLADNLQEQIDVIAKEIYEEK